MPARRPQFLHVVVLRGLDVIDVGSPEGRAVRLQRVDCDRDGLLLLVGERFPPGLELVGDLDLPHSSLIISYIVYIMQVI